MTSLSLTYSFWWIFICLLVAGGYAWIQYSKVAPWSKRLNNSLAVLRIVLVAFICFLLVEPYVQSSTNFIEKPLMLLGVDNSKSITLNSTTNELEELQVGIHSINEELAKKGYNVKIVDLDGNLIEHVDSIHFTKNITNLSDFFNSTKKAYANFNFSGMVLFSDGIFNSGYSPLAINNKLPVYTIGLGDTSHIKDLSIKQVINNATVFEGNILQVEVQVLNTGMGPVSTEISVYQKGKKVVAQPVLFTSGQKLVKSTLSIPIVGSGKQSLNIRVTPQVGEHTTLNNQTSIYFDVINARKRVLILASAPHPDIKAIKTSIEKNEYYEVDIAYKWPDKLNYELIILHQYPSIKTSNQEKEILLKSNIPKWVILGTSSDLNFLKTRMGVLKSYAGLGRKLDVVSPLLNPSFDQFQLDDSFTEWAASLPPIYTPYGITLSTRFSQVLLQQQIGSVATNQPLLLFVKQNEANPTMGIFLGEGLWRWKLDEFRSNQSHKNFDQLISKTVQYLSSSADKKRFYSSPQKETYEEGEDVLFITQEYNALFERISGKKVRLNITNEIGEKQSYTYMPINNNSVFKISGLAQGVYSYRATTEMDSVNYSSTGQFVVQKLNYEAINPVADFDMLQKLATKSGGSFYELSQIGDFVKAIEYLNPISIIHSTEKEEPFINIKWVLLMLITLATAEWFLRKFYGGY